jgi:hypothetical protein
MHVAETRQAGSYEDGEAHDYAVHRPDQSKETAGFAHSHTLYAHILLHLANKKVTTNEGKVTRT